MFEAQGSVIVTMLPQEIILEGIIRQTSATHLVVACNSTHSDLGPGQQVMVEQHHKGSYYQFQTTIIQMRENCFVAPFMPPQLVQRRRNTRIACHLSGYLRELPSGENTPDIDAEYIPLQIIDISLGGAQALTETLPNMEVRHEIQIYLSEREGAIALAKILRSKELTAGMKQSYPETNFSLAIQFVEMTRVHQIQIQRFLIKHPSHQ